MSADRSNRHKFILLYETSKKNIADQLNEMVEDGNTIINYDVMHDGKLLVEYIPKHECHLFD